MKQSAIKHILRHGRTTFAAATVLALAACATPPAKLGPPTLRTDAPLAGVNAPERDGWPAEQWWRSYGDTQLDLLVERALQQAPDLALAQSRVSAAEQSARLAAAQLGLSINGSAQLSRQRLSDHGLFPSQLLGFSWYNQADIGAQLQYDFDWWGKKRATMSAALDQTHAASAQRAAAALAIQYAVADTYFGWQADQARMKLADDLVTTQQKLVDIAGARVRQGVDLPDTLQQASAQLAAARQMRVALDGSAQIRKVTLASLLGVAPANLPALEVHALPGVDAGIPADAGLDLVVRRPDVIASLWQVQAALRHTDVARAEFYPDVSINALAGVSSIDMGKLLTAGSRVFALTPALHLPIFNSGTLQANYALSKAQLAAAVAQYDSAVLTAAREVGTEALAAQQIAAQRHEQQAEVDADAALVRSAQARASQGVRDAREQLAARAQWLLRSDETTQLHAQALSTDLALIKSLGGGYRDDGQPASATSPESPTPVSSGAVDHERH